MPVSVSHRAVDGGAAVMDLLLQHLADQARLDVLRPQSIETTALGAAYAAGLAVGYWTSTADITQNWGVDRRWRPDMAAATRERLFARWEKAVTRSLDWVDD